MTVPFYDIKAQYDELQAPMDAAVHAVISSGDYSMGENHKLIEKELAELHRAKHGIAVNSGTDALRIIMDAAGIGHGDEVVTAAFTFVASVETIVQTGARPVFVDIDPATFCIDAAKIEAAITPKTKAIQPIHLFGQLANVKTITEIARKYDLFVIEDAAQAIGSHNDGVPAGNFGIGAGFSFYVTKNLGAAGDAGLIVTNDDDIAEACRSIRVHGMGRERYYYDHIGYTSRMDEVQAAILRVKLTKFHEWNERRSKLAAVYNEVLADSPVTLPTISSGNNTTWHQFSIRSDRRDALRAYLKDRGVDSMIYYPVPIHFHKPYEHFGNGKGSLPETERAATEVLNLPIHAHLTIDQVAHAAKSIAEFCSLSVKNA